MATTAARSRPSNSHSTWLRNCRLLIDCSQVPSQPSRRGLRIATGRSASAPSKVACQGSACPISMEPARNTADSPGRRSIGAGGLRTRPIDSSLAANKRFDGFQLSSNVSSVCSTALPGIVSPPAAPRKEMPTSSSAVSPAVLRTATARRTPGRTMPGRSTKPSAKWGHSRRNPGVSRTLHTPFLVIVARQWTFRCIRCTQVADLLATHKSLARKYLRAIFGFVASARISLQGVWGACNATK